MSSPSHDVSQPAAHLSEAALRALRALPAPGWTPALVGACARVLDEWMTDTAQEALAALRTLEVASPSTAADMVLLDDVIRSEGAARSIESGSAAAAAELMPRITAGLVIEAADMLAELADDIDGSRTHDMARASTLRRIVEAAQLETACDA